LADAGRHRRAIGTRVGTEIVSGTSPRVDRRPSIHSTRVDVGQRKAQAEARAYAETHPVDRIPGLSSTTPGLTAAATAGALRG
jgi:hypothetical protein